MIITVFRLLTDFVCLYTYEFWLYICKIVRSSVILLLTLIITCRSHQIRPSSTYEENIKIVVLHNAIQIRRDVPRQIRLSSLCF